MNAFKKIIIVAIASVVSFNVQGQGIEKLGVQKLKAYGKGALLAGDTYTAIDYFEAYMVHKPQDFRVAFDLAECHRLARNYPKAKDWYKKAYDLKPAKNVVALFYYAQMLKVEQDYETALQTFNKFKKEYSDSKDERQLKRLLRDQIPSCDIAKHLMDSAIKVSISHFDTSINKQSVEAAPVYLNDKEFLYTSLRSDTPVYYRVNTMETMTVPVRQIYKASKDGKIGTFVGLWEEAGVNVADTNTANGVFSPDRNRFYFTRCFRNVQEFMVCKIYVTEKKDGRWAKARLLPATINDDKYTSTQPAVGIDSKTMEEVLYFVSNRKDGRGGLDIWYSSYNKKSKSWKTPRNCGSEINTAGDEMSPFIDNENRVMYFSSNGLPGLGEHDIFRATGEGSKFLPAENIGSPINSSYDDIFYVVNSSRDQGFFVSNRPGGVNTLHPTCCDDLYSFVYNEVIKVATSGTVFAISDAEINKLMEDKLDMADLQSEENLKDTSRKPLSESIVSLYLIDKIKNDLIYIKNDTTDSAGKFFFSLDPGKEYMLEFENYGNFNKKLKLSTRKVSESDTLILKPIGVNVMPKQPLIIRNIYYDYDKADLKPVVKRTIDSSLLKIMKDYPSLVIEISAHTDSKGEDDYNKKLSQKRAESVVNYLISRGIDSKRLRAKGFGEEKPIAPNDNADGTDNPVGREKNRRTEFRIIGSLSQYSEIIYEE